MTSKPPQPDPQSGLILLDKPVGMSSHEAVRRVKRLTGVAKAGHTGSLDPLASGLLPVCLNEATKFARFFLEADKTYQVEAKLGVTTSTGDAEGPVCAVAPVPARTVEAMEQVLRGFTGSIEQLPPMHSAIKHRGQPLYRWARRGETVKRPTRRVTIYQCRLLAYQGDHLGLLVVCSKGTYIRTLIEDLGQALGCGAHVTLLRRLAIQHLPEQPLVSLASLAAEESDWPATMISLEQALIQWPALYLQPELQQAMVFGQTVSHPQLPKKDSWVRLLTESGRFMGMGQVTAEGCLAPKRLLRDLHL